MKRKLRIAMIGQKGIPARYGGVETHVEEISTRLAAGGHDVSVFCRRRLRPREEELGTNGCDRTEGGLMFKGVRLLYRGSVNSKHLDAATHTLLCAVESALWHRFDIVHFHGVGPSAFVPIVRAAGKTVVSTVHALDWRQAKWGRWAKARLKQGEVTAVRRSHGVIAVSKIIADQIGERFGVEARHIPNGATVASPRSPANLSRFGLKGDDYILTVGRIIADRGLHHLISAYGRLQTSMKLVIVGSEQPRSEYSDWLESLADDRVVFTGDRYGEEVAELYANCRLYVLASEVEGLPITVCEAMGHGRPVLLSDIPENREIGGDVARYFKTSDVNSLHRMLEVMLEDRDDLASRGRRGRERIAASYNWDDLAGQVEAYYFDVLERRGRG